MQKLEVFSPIGDDTMARKAVAPPLDTLDGKTIGEVWNGVYKGTETFPGFARASAAALSRSQGDSVYRIPRKLRRRDTERTGRSRAENCGARESERL